MVKKNDSRRLGIMRESETRFLYLSESEKKKHYSDDYQRQLYKRITDGANHAFQDFLILLARLPENQLDKIEFESGLNSIHKKMAKVYLSNREPHKVFETARLSLEDSLKIIAKNYNQKLASMAKSDFDLTIDWLEMAQKYPKPTGAP